MRRIFSNIFIVAILGALVYWYHGPLIARWTQWYARYFPCRQPITYSIGSFDTRFGISKEIFLTAIQKSEALWEKAVGKDLFIYTPSGTLPINLVFDYRQEATIKMRAIGLAVGDDQASYDALLAKYKALKNEFATKHASYEALVSEINRRTEGYNAEVAKWNREKGAPEDVYSRLNAEKISLKTAVENIHAYEGELKTLQDTINALVTVVNQVANNINVSATEFNRIGATQGKEFTEGLYTSGIRGQRIDIFQFDTTDKLVRVLAHELGHALSLEHVDDPKAIMYRLNQGANLKPTATDISALKKHCGIE